jgi:dihydrofolate reductase
MISIVVAMAQNNVIGGNNKLLWHLPADMRFFRTLTTGNIIIMGRKTFDSIGKPLPNRDNIVISRDKNLKIEGCIVVNSLEMALQKSAEINKNFPADLQKQIYIIGGEQIYKQSLPFAQKLYITEVLTAFEGDAFFPEIDLNSWKETKRTNLKKDEKNSFDYNFVEYLLKNKIN